MIASCGYCGKSFEIMTGHYNRASKLGLKVYCCRKHSGLGRRLNKTEAEKKEAKFWYDAFNRLALRDEIKVKKAAYFAKDYAINPEKYKNWRRKKQQWQNEYCRQTEYRKWKQQYDRTYRANKFYGPMADAFLAWMDLKNYIDNRFAKKQNDLTNKNQKRKRLCQKQRPKKRLNSLLQP